MAFLSKKKILAIIIIIAAFIVIEMLVYRVFFAQKGNQPIVSIPYTIINTYPHSINSYTQGLFFDGDTLYESTGSPDYISQTRSVFGLLDLNTGEIDIKAELDRDIYFGEGSTQLNDKIYQLTYKNQKGFVYDASTFKEINTFTYPSGEGWGLTTDGTYLIMSDGTDKITYLNPQTFEVIRIIEVKRNQLPQRALNELEYVDGYIFANIYQTNNIVKINSNNGEIVGVVDLSHIVNVIREESPNIAELNGIAYKSSTDTFFITGKLWPQIYEIRLNT